MCGGDAAFLSYYLDGLSYIYTIINMTDEFRNVGDGSGRGRLGVVVARKTDLN